MSAATRTCWVLIPVKAPGAGKTRLAGVLDARGRNRLVAAMLKRVVSAAVDCPHISRICMVSSADHGWGDQVTLICDRGGGLNAALGDALEAIACDAPDRVIIIAADLPQVEAADLTMLADLPKQTIAIAPDRHGTGTNALSLPLAALRDFEPRFGLLSHAAHRAQALRLGYNVEAMLSAGLEKDVDHPTDLADARAYLQEVHEAPEGMNGYN